MKESINNEAELIASINEINDGFWEQRGNITVEIDPMALCAEALEKARSINYTYGVARCYLSLGIGTFILKHNAESSLKLLNQALPIFKELDDKKWIANTLLTLAIITNSSGKPEAALYYALKGIEFFEKNEENSLDYVRAYYITGTVYKDLKKYADAEKYYKTGVRFDSQNNMWSGRIYTGLSNIYTENGQYEKALELGYKSLDILRFEKNNIGESRALSDIGAIYKKLKKYDEALRYFSEGLKIREDVNMRPFVLGSLIDIAATYIDKGDKKEAIAFFLKAEVIALETNLPVRLAHVYQSLATLYKLTNNYTDSIDYYEKFIQLTLELNRKESETKISNLQSSLLHEKEQEIERLKNVELKNAYRLITEKNKEITDSIEYAKRIQTALITSEIYFEKSLNKLIKD